MNKVLFKMHLSFSVLIFLLFLLFVGCKKEDDFDAKKIISRMSEMSDLGTVEYRFTKILKGEDDSTWYKVGGRKILISTKAYVKAGVDFSQIEVVSLDEENRIIEIAIPKGKIISMSMPAEEITVLQTEVDFFRDNFSNKDIDKVQDMGEAEILKKIKELKIEEEAQKNAKLFLEKWLIMSGFKEVKISK